MTEVSAALVKELRERTGAGMMDCKRALQEAEGDLDVAHRLLREWGAAQAGKRAGRATTEGVVLARVQDSTGTLVAVGSETEPVAKNEEFRAFAERVLDLVERKGPEAVVSLEDERTDLIAKIGENIVVRGAARFESSDGQSLATYVHPPANKIGVLVKAEGPADAARRLAMHIAFAAPRYAVREQVPEQDRPKIVEGMLGKRFFAETVLADQSWIHDPGKTVGQALEEEGLRVLEFARYALAE